MIETKIDRPVRGATLIGKGSEVLLRIDMVGQVLDFGTGMCGSLSGSILRMWASLWCGFPK